MQRKFYEIIQYVGKVLPHLIFERKTHFRIEEGVEQQIVGNTWQESRGRRGGHRARRRPARRRRAGRRVGTSRVVANFGKFLQNFARFRLYRHRSLQVNTHFAAFFKIYQMIQLTFLKFGKFCKFCNIYKLFAEFSRKLLIFQTEFLLKL